MKDHQAEILHLSETAEDLPDFLTRACKLLGVSMRSASIQAGLSEGTAWGIASGAKKRGSEETIAKLALFFKVPEVNLLRLAGYTAQQIPPDYGLSEAQDIFQVLTPEEKDKWLEHGRLLIKARD